MRIIRSVEVRELKKHTAKILRQVNQQGVEIQITRRGQPIARLASSQRERISTRRKATIWTNLDELATEIGARWSPKVSAVDEVRAGRREF